MPSLLKVSRSDNSTEILVSNDTLSYHPIALHWNTLPEMHKCTRPEAAKIIAPGNKKRR